MPSADDFDYAHVTQQCRLYQDYVDSTLKCTFRGV
jgi:hypothetical protein